MGEFDFDFVLILRREFLYVKMVEIDMYYELLVLNFVLCLLVCLRVRIDIKCRSYHRCCI